MHDPRSIGIGRANDAAAISPLRPVGLVPAGAVETVISAVESLADGVKLFRLALPPGAAGFGFQPGAHIDVHLPAAGIRQYSLLPAADGQVEFAVKLETDGKGGSKHLHALAAGDRLVIGPVRNNFPLVAAARHSVFIAGGIGLTPILGMIATCVASGASWELHFRARSRRCAAFWSALQAHGARVACSFSDEGHAGGRAIADIVAAAPAGTHFYCCGPERMIADFEAASAARDPAQVHVERFAAAETAAAYGGYTVEFRRSGKTVAVQPGETILQAALRAGLDVSHSCSEGVCGACETRVLEGVPDHKDAVLSAEDRAGGRLIMICCSGSLKEKLVLDL